MGFMMSDTDRRVYRLEWSNTHFKVYTLPYLPCQCLSIAIGDQRKSSDLAISNQNVKFSEIFGDSVK